MKARGQSPLAGACSSWPVDVAWWGSDACRARVGLKVGILAFALPIGVFHRYFGTRCGIDIVLIVNAVTGLGAGVLLSIHSARLECRHDAFLLGAGPLVLLSGTLGCLFFGPIGVASMTIGYVVSTVPVMVYRGATA